MALPQSTVSNPVPAPVGVPATNVSPVDSQSKGRSLDREVAAMKKLGGSPITVDPVSLFDYVYTPEELANIPEYQRLKSTQGGIQQAQNQMSAIKPTQTGMTVLEQALRMKNDPGQQQIGKSQLFNQAGLGANYANLSQSLKENSLQMARKYDSFANQLQVVGAYMSDAYNTALDGYKTLTASWDKDVQRLDAKLKDITAHEQAMEVMNRQHALDKELLAIKNQYDIDSDNRQYDSMYNGGSYGDGGQPTNLGWANLITGTGTITAYGSKDASGKDVWAAGLDVAASRGTPLTAPGNIKILTSTGSKYTSLGANNVKGKGQNGGFGNQVKGVFTDGPYKGYEVWLSHLDSVNSGVKEGQTYGAGDVLGYMGNTGYTMSSRSDDDAGVHVDITMRSPNGKLLTAKEVSKILGTPTTKSPQDLGTAASKKIGEVSSTLGKGAQILSDTFLGDKGFKAGVTPNIDVNSKTATQEAKVDQEALEIQFILDNQKTMDAIRNTMNGKSESEAIFGIKATIKTAYGFTPTDNQTKMIYNSL